jgi:aspartate/glutamate racemase
LYTINTDLIKNSEDKEFVNQLKQNIANFDFNFTSDCNHPRSILRNRKRRYSGGLNFSRCVIYSFNFADIKKNQDTNNWEATFQMLVEACEHLKESGAKAIVLCTNTMHLLADRLEQKINIPVIHIAKVTALEISKRKLKKVGLLGTKFTMELDFFKSKLSERA